MCVRISAGVLAHSHVGDARASMQHDATQVLRLKALHEHHHQIRPFPVRLSSVWAPRPVAVVAGFRPCLQTVAGPALHRRPPQADLPKRCFRH